MATIKKLASLSPPEIYTETVVMIREQSYLPEDGKPLRSRRRRLNSQLVDKARYLAKMIGGAEITHNAAAKVLCFDNKESHDTIKELLYSIEEGRI